MLTWITEWKPTHRIYLKDIVYEVMMIGTGAYTREEYEQRWEPEWNLVGGKFIHGCFSKMAADRVERAA